jgi:tagatose-1,6-bisphosphate aldolase
MIMQGLTDSTGRFSILAIDHRDSLRQFLAPEDPASIDDASITDLKIEVVESLADLATGVMLEPEYSIPQVPDAGVLPEGVGFLAALEAQGYLDDPEAEPTRLLDGWSPAQAKASGASSAKLLLPYRPDGRLVDEQEAFALQMVEECHAHELPIALEPLFYGLASADHRSDLIVETAQRFATFGADLLKLPFPGSAVACAQVTEAVDVPWAMLSGGGSFDDFADQIAVANAAGCSGFMVGRALWGEAVRAPAADRAGLLQTLVRPRFERLVALNTEASHV